MNLAPQYENTYRTEPKETERFYPSKVKACIEEIVTGHLQDKEYDHPTAKNLAERIADQIKASVKALNIPQYKIVVQTVIG